MAFEKLHLLHVIVLIWYPLIVNKHKTQFYPRTRRLYIHHSVQHPDEE